MDYFSILTVNLDMYLCDAGSLMLSDRNFRHDLERPFLFINEIQGKVVVIYLSFGDKNRFYIDYFSIVNVGQICICLGPRGHRVT